MSEQLEALQERLKVMVVAEEKETTRLKEGIKSKSYKITKTIIVSILVFLALIGTLGSMHWGIFSKFSMEDYTSFIGSYAPIFITLIGSIAFGGVAKNGFKAISKKNNLPKELEEDIDDEYQERGDM